MDVTAEAGALFGNDPRHEGVVLLHDLTNGNTARQAIKHPTDAIVGKSMYIYIFPLAMSTYDELGPGVYTLIKELAIRREDKRSEFHSEKSEKSWRLVKGRGAEMACLKLRLFFVLQQALPFSTRHPSEDKG